MPATRALLRLRRRLDCRNARSVALSWLSCTPVCSRRRIRAPTNIRFDRPDRSHPRARTRSSLCISVVIGSCLKLPATRSASAVGWDRTLTCTASLPNCFANDSSAWHETLSSQLGELQTTMKAHSSIASLMSASHDMTAGISRLSIHTGMPIPVNDAVKASTQPLSSRLYDTNT